MGAATLRSSRIFSVLSSVFLLGFACFALRSHHHWIDNSAANLPTSRFELPWPDHFGVTLGRSPVNRAPVIDPVLVYSTFLGGISLSAGGAPNLNTGGGGAPFYQGATAIYVDPSGNLYVVGATSADDFPVTSGVVQPVNSNNDFVGFLSKIDPSGHLVFSTYLDGMSAAAAIAIDTTGNIYVAGINPAPPEPPLPVPAGTAPFDPTPKPISIMKLNSTATTILNATYLGGSGVDLVTGLALDQNGDVYLAGSTTSNDFPTLNPLQASLGASGKNVFVTKMNSSLSSLVYSTYLGLDSYTVGAATESPTHTASHGIAVDSSGDAYVVGYSNAGFPITPGAVEATCPSACPFMAKLNPSGTSLLYSSFLIGDGQGISDFVSAIAVDASQNVFLAGTIATPGFSEVNPISPCPAPATEIGERTDGSGFVSEISPGGTLIFSTCLGQFLLGPGGNPGMGIDDMVLDSSGNVYVIGDGDPPLMNPVQSDSATESYLSLLLIPGLLRCSSPRILPEFNSAIPRTAPPPALGSTPMGISTRQASSLTHSTRPSPLSPPYQYSTLCNL